MSLAVASRSPLATCRRVTVIYGSGQTRVAALRDVDLEIASGEHLALLGRSGSGKTTLLHVLGGLVTPSSGAVRWKDTELSALDAAARGRARAQGIAYVFQGSNLFPHLTAWENIAFAERAASRRDAPRLGTEALLSLVGLSDKADFLPSELSGGESQRVAVARALAQGPELLLCDEPTGHLDTDTGARVLDMIEALRRELGFGLVVATHDPDVAVRAERAVGLSGGRLSEE